MNNPLKNYHDAADVFLSRDLPLDAYLSAIDVMRSSLKEMSGDYFRYINGINEVRQKLEPAAFFNRGHDEALVELIRTVPFSMALANRFFGKDEASKVMMSALVESYCRQEFMLFGINRNDFVGIISRLIDLNLQEEVIAFTRHLIESNTGNYDDLAGLVVYMLSERCSFADSEPSLIKQWLIGNGKFLTNQSWSEYITNHRSLNTFNAVYRAGMEDIGLFGMANCGASAEDDDLIIREQLSGIKPKAGECQNNKALLSYVIWSSEFSFPIIEMSDLVVSCQTIEQAVKVAKEHNQFSQQNFSEVVGLALRKAGTVEAFFEIIKKFVNQQDDFPDNLIKSGLVNLLDRNKHNFQNIKKIANNCDENAIELDGGILFLYRDIINVTFIAAARETNRARLFLLELKTPVCKIIDHDILIEQVSHLCRKLDESVLMRVANTTSPLLVQAIPMLQRAKLGSDLGL